MTSHSKNQISHFVRQACRLEVLASKPGNVSPNHRFSNTHCGDFLKSAEAISPILADVSCQQIGQRILNAVAATQQVVGHNTNLGIILLLAPLCAVQDWSNAKTEIHDLLSQASVSDAVRLYEAIRMTSAGGLGRVAEQDVAGRPTVALLECMQLAADRDSIAEQYCTDYAFVFDTGVSLLLETASWTSHHQDRLGWVAVQILAAQQDSLIVRKCGSQIADTAQKLAQKTLSAGWPFESQGQIAYNALHTYLIDDGHQRNPGTTADLIAAILFCALRSEIISCDLSESSMQFTKCKP